LYDDWIGEELTGHFKRTLYGAHSLVEHIFILSSAVDAYSKTHGTIA